MDFSLQLAKQLGFIERSCKAFDEGHENEAARIAVAIRVILHDTRTSRSLLTHLGAKEMIALMAYSGAFEDRPGLIQADLLTLFGPKGAIPACFGPPYPERYVSAETWWNEIVFAQGEVRVTRQTLRTRSRHPHHALEVPAVVARRPTSATMLGRQQRPDQRPLFVRNPDPLAQNAASERQP